MRILIADDHQFILESLEILINTIDGFEVLATFENGKALLDALVQYDRVDIVLTDYHMPEMNGLELTYQIRQKYPSIKVILLTVSEDASTIEAAFKAGVAGYLMKKAGKAEIKMALDTVAAGKKYYSESVVFELLNRDKNIADLANEPIAEKLKTLSDREIEIIKLVASELNTNEIAERLYLSPATVETHRHNILKKLGIKSAVGLVRFAVDNGLV